MIIRYSRSIYANEDKDYSCCGSKFIDEFILDNKKDGGVCLKKTGEKNIYAIIQANKVNCDLSSVLETVVHENQLNVTEQNELVSVISDFTGMHDLPSILAGVKRLERTWDETPLEVREAFQSDKTVFVNSIGDDSFIQKIEDGYKRYNAGLSKRIDVAKPQSVVEVQSPANEGSVSDFEKEV